MTRLQCFCFLWPHFLTAARSSDNSLVSENLRPIIAILTQPLGTEIGNQSKHGNETYIAASYVKWVESAGGRVVPLHYDTDASEISAVLLSVNGVLFPGGGTSFNKGSKMRATGHVIYNFATRSNDAGRTFPLWGTCLGFQFMAVLAADDDNIICSKCYNTEGIPLPLNFSVAARHSHLFGAMSDHLYNDLATQNITENSHHDGIRPSLFLTNPKLKATFQVLSTNKDDKGASFASTYESAHYPFAASQWHPEKANFEWGVKLGPNAIPHSAAAVAASQYLANQFLDKARQNHFSYPSEEAETQALIYNYHASPDPNGYFTQIYRFQRH